MVFVGEYAEDFPSRHNRDYGPLNIHYHDFEEIELANPNYFKRMNALIRSVGRAVRDFAIPVGKRISRRRTIRCRQEFCSGPLSGDEDFPGSQRTQRNLDRSPFLALPLELRQKIYEYYYHSDALKIQDLTYDGTYMLTHYKPVSEQWPPGRGPNKDVWNNFLGLPFTCRTIYPEAIVYLYAKCAFRFTDPGLALRIPKTMPTSCLRSLRSLDFAFIMSCLVRQFDMLDVRAHYMQFDVCKLPLSTARKRNKWLGLWSIVASLPHLERVSLKLYQQQTGQIQHHYLANADQLPKLHDRLSQYILSPLFQFEKDTGREVEVDLCWQPEDALCEKLEERGFKVLLNGRVRGYVERP